MASDRKDIVFFRIIIGDGQAGDVGTTEQQLLDMLAGAPDLATLYCIDIDDIPQPPCPEEVATDSEADVNVDAKLAHCLNTEVTKYSASLQSKRRTSGATTWTRCQLCPFRSFAPSDKQLLNIRQHVQSQHTSARRLGLHAFIASGTKQLKVVRALYDLDMLKGRDAGDYLHRSAQGNRSGVHPPLCSASNNIDRGLAFVLTGKGPMLMSKASLAHSNSVRRVGHTYYTKCFAECALTDAVLEHGRARPMRGRLLSRFVASGCQLALMIPRNVRGMLDLLEDLMQAPGIARLEASLLHNCCQHDEFVHVAMDATLRTMLRVKGQAPFNTPKDIRQQAAVGDELALRRIMTMRGRTGAVFIMSPIRGESTADIMGCMTENCTEPMLSQVRYIATDQPSRKFFVGLSSILPNLQGISLDQFHLVISYCYAWAEKRSPGQKALRIIQNKFNMVDRLRDAEHWGPFYDGSLPCVHTQTEDIACLNNI